MLTCKFGDEEDFEEVSCSYNNDADQILCRRPLRSRRNDKSNDLIGAKMTVSFADQSNNVILQEVSPVITVQDGGGGSIELKQFKPVTGADCNEEVLYTRYITQLNLTVFTTCTGYVKLLFFYQYLQRGTYLIRKINCS